MWSDAYTELTNRNIGLLTVDQQEKLRNASVAVCGLGGVGGVPAEILARTGITSFKLLDCGRFEPTNSNRQIYSFEDTRGRLKTDVTEEYLKKINPEITVEKYVEIDENNVDAFLNGVDVVILAIDSVIPCLIISRAARRLDIPMVEGWALAFGNVRVITNDTPSLEALYGFNTVGRDISSITEKEAFDLMMQSIDTAAEIDGLSEVYQSSARQRLVERGEGTTLAPMVWMTCVMLAMETVKIILGWGDIALAPEFVVFDGMHHRTIRREMKDE